MLFHADTSPEQLNRDFGVLQSAVGSLAFPSHTPGGIDWNIQTFLPTEHTKTTLGPYFPYNIFLFDLTANCRTLWGEDFRSQLPIPPDPRLMAQSAIDYMMKRIDALPDQPDAARKIAFSTFKAIQIAQMAFGEITLDKKRLPSLYITTVPDFPMKQRGLEIIRNYLLATYPDRPPQYRTRSYYSDFLSSLSSLPVKLIPL